MKWGVQMAGISFETVSRGEAKKFGVKGMFVLSVASVVLHFFKAAFGNIFVFCAGISLILLAGELVWYRIKKYGGRNRSVKRRRKRLAGRKQE